MLRKLKLHGELAKFVGQDEFEAVMRTSAEAIRFLVTNFPKVEAYMSDKYYQVLVGKEDIDKEDLHNPTGQSDIHIVPVITGAGSGTGKTLLGAALIGASFFFPGAGLFGTYGVGMTPAVIAGKGAFARLSTCISNSLCPTNSASAPYSFSLRNITIPPSCTFQ